jgi:hypothetical protein
MLASAVTLGVAAVSQSSVAHQQVPPVGSPAPTGAAAPEFKVQRSVEELAQLDCLPGVERFLPGVYYHCVGVRDVARGKNDRARSMLGIAAGWGSKPAQFLLGVGYYKGDLQPRDRARGLAWLKLASERKDPTYLAVFDSAWKQATPRERASAQQLWRSMLPVYGDQRAARRAEWRFRHEREALLARRQTNGQQVCIAGLTTGKIEPLPVMKGFEDNTSACGGSDVPAVFVAKRLDSYAEQLFDGWKGHVSVGNLQAVPVSPK